MDFRNVIKIMMKVVVIIINFTYMTSGRIIFNFSFKKSQNSLGITTQQNAKSANTCYIEKD